jgi:hypothetical protein
MCNCPAVHVPLLNRPGVQSRADSDHNPRKGVAKDFLPKKMAERPRYRLTARLYEVHDNRAISRSQHASEKLWRLNVPLKKLILSSALND